MMMWPAVVTVLWMAQAALAIQNSTAIVVTHEGWEVHPCYQVNHREADLDPSVFGSGLWYAIEKIDHRGDINSGGIYLSSRCPKINFYKNPPSEIKLKWQEKGGSKIFTFRMTDPENDGFWITNNRQTGDLVDKEHRQFDGSVQVLEAQSNRMVLTFCSQEKIHYSLILVRNISFLHDTEPTRRMISGYGLSDVRVTQNCKDVDGSATTSACSIGLMVASWLLLSYSHN